MNETKNSKPRVVQDLTNEAQHVAVLTSGDCATIAIRADSIAAVSRALAGAQARHAVVPQGNQPLGRVLDALAVLGWNERQALGARPRVFARSGAPRELVLDVEDGTVLGARALQELAAAIGVRDGHLGRTFQLLEQAERRERAVRADLVHNLEGDATRGRRG